MTVGVAGLVLRAAASAAFPNAYGMRGGRSLIEAEIVTADGVDQNRSTRAVRIPDLFWALKGGGGGTFGVVTRRHPASTHALPECPSAA